MKRDLNHGKYHKTIEPVAQDLQPFGDLKGGVDVSHDVRTAGHVYQANQTYLEFLRQRARIR